MPIHKVRKGDCVASIAAEYGFADWRAVWNHPGNADLRARRKSPNVLLEGDDVVLPEPRKVMATVPAGKDHRFVLRLPRARLRLELHDRRGRALASRRFELTVGGETLSGTTDDAGRIDEPIPARAQEAELRVFLDGDRELEIPLAVGHLDPEDSESGVRQRLRNLGYLREREPDDEVITSALREFQRDNGLELTGSADDATQGQLRHHHKI